MVLRVRQKGQPSAMTADLPISWRTVLTMLVLVLVLPGASDHVEAADRQPLQVTNPLFAFDNAFPAGWTPERQAALLAELGYAGVGATGTADLPRRLEAFESQGLRIFSIYVGARLGEDGPQYDPGLEAAIQALAGHETILWLFVQGHASDAEQQAVRVVREIADLAAPAGLRVVLYPHVGFYVARVEDAVRLARAAERDNVGASFNLCHFLKLDDEGQLRKRLTAAMPYLELVSINGSDAGDTRQMGWDRLIQTLDRGTFDNRRLLGLLMELGYEGPIGLQCYNVPGDPRENLARSIAAWREWVRPPAAEDD